MLPSMILAGVMIFIPLVELTRLLCTHFFNEYVFDKQGTVEAHLYNKTWNLCLIN